MFFFSFETYNACLVTLSHMSLDSSTCEVIGYALDDWGSILNRTQPFYFVIISKPDPGPTQLPIQWVPAAPFPSIKRPECEADHSPSSRLRL